MQDIGSDMDDLLRKAADNYPLKEGRDDWEVIASKISPVQADAKPFQKKEHRKYYLLLLLILLFIGFGFYFSMEKNKPGYRPAPHQNHEDEKLVTPPSLVQNDARSLKHPGLKKTAGNTGNNGKGLLKGKLILNDKDDNKRGEAASAYSETVPAPSGTYRDGSRPDQYIQGSGRSAITVSFSPIAHPESIDPFSRREEKKRRPSNDYREGFYFGIVAGPAVSTVKSGNLRKAGFDFGILGGYRFTKKLSLETGLLKGQRFYTCKGEDFSMDAMGAMMQPGMQMMEVEGSSRVLVIPLHIRYELPAVQKHRFFSAAGFSSYVLTNESNWYHTMVNGSKEMLYGSYAKDRLYFAAAIDLSLGYEKNLGSRLNLRLEPYVQIPVKDMGIGSLPVTSAGLRVGIIRASY